MCDSDQAGTRPTVESFCTVSWALGIPPVEDEVLCLPLPLGDDEHIIEEEEVQLLPARPPGEQPRVSKGRQLPALHQPSGCRDQREGLRG